MTLEGIAVAFGIDVSELMRRNKSDLPNITEKGRLKKGTAITIERTKDKEEREKEASGASGKKKRKQQRSSTLETGNSDDELAETEGGASDKKKRKQQWSSTLETDNSDDELEETDELRNAELLKRVAARVVKIVKRKGGDDDDIDPKRERHFTQEEKDNYNELMSIWTRVSDDDLDARQLEQNAPTPAAGEVLFDESEKGRKAKAYFELTSSAAERARDEALEAEHEEEDLARDESIKYPKRYVLKTNSRAERHRHRGSDVETSEHAHEQHRDSEAADIPQYIANTGSGGEEDVVRVANIAKTQNGFTEGTKPPEWTLDTWAEHMDKNHSRALDPSNVVDPATTQDDARADRSEEDLGKVTSEEGMPVKLNLPGRTHTDEEINDLRKEVREKLAILSLHDELLSGSV
jgi:hypothetical protein